MSVAAVAARARAAPPACGDVRVVGIDGRSGAGKSTFARALAAELDAPVLELERIYPGWEGLERGIDRLVGDVLAPLAAGRIALAPQYDWAAQDWGPAVPVLPTPMLVLEGVGAGARRVGRYLSLLVWLEAGEDVRKARALRRDGEAYRPYWDLWAAQEREHLRRETTAARADVVIRTVEEAPRVG